MKRLSTLLLLLTVGLMPCLTFAQPTEPLVPLTDMGESRYLGFYGLLYPISNACPAAHDIAGRAMASMIQPLDTSGRPDPNGRIVFLSIGMSNATQEFSTFRQLADVDSNRNRLNPRLVLVDGAQGGQTAEIIQHDTANYWRVIDQRLRAAGVTRRQVQAAWVKEADARPTDSFPYYSVKLCKELVEVSKIMKARYPNIRIAYYSSRTYGGYATTMLNPEPYAYQSGFAVKWLLEVQMSGDTSLAFSGDDAKAPWMAWGPYLWADGTTPRSDGLTWERSDFVDDGTHPSTSGRQKVAGLLWKFLTTDPTAMKWFLRQEPSSVPSRLLWLRGMSLW